MRNRPVRRATGRLAAKRLSRPGALRPLARQDGLKHVEDAPLPLAGERGELLEDPLGAAGRAAPRRLLRGAAKQRVNRNPEAVGERRHLFGLQADALAFPVGHEPLSLSSRTGRQRNRENGRWPKSGPVLSSPHGRSPENSPCHRLR